MRKTVLKSLKLEIIPVYQISTTDKNKQDYPVTDPISVTGTFITKIYDRQVVK